MKTKKKPVKSSKKTLVKTKKKKVFKPKKVPPSKKALKELSEDAKAAKILPNADRVWFRYILLSQRAHSAYLDWTHRRKSRERYSVYARLNEQAHAVFEHWKSVVRITGLAIDETFEDEEVA